MEPVEIYDLWNLFMSCGKQKQPAQEQGGEISVQVLGWLHLDRENAFQPSVMILRKFTLMHSASNETIWGETKR